MLNVHRPPRANAARDFDPQQVERREVRRADRRIEPAEPSQSNARGTADDRDDGDARPRRVVRHADDVNERREGPARRHASESAERERDERRRHPPLDVLG